MKTSAFHSNKRFRCAADRFHVHAAEGFSVDYAGPRPDGGGLRWVSSVGSRTYAGVIGGGAANTIQDGAQWAIIGGGSGNTIQSNARFAAIPGGGVELMHLDSSGLWVKGTFVSGSDRNSKTNLFAVNPREVLEKVAALPISTWNYKDDPVTPHLGPMAQDFHAAFDIGPDDKHIATVDADGVALTAIQGLNQKLTEELKRRDAALIDSSGYPGSPVFRFHNAGTLRKSDARPARAESNRRRQT